MNYGKRLCLQCKKEFEATYAAQITCGDKCKKERQQGWNKKRWETIKITMARVPTLEERVKELEGASKERDALKEKLSRLEAELEILRKRPAVQEMASGEKSAQVRKLKADMAALERENADLKARLSVYGAVM